MARVGADEGSEVVTPGNHAPLKVALGFVVSLFSLLPVHASTPDAARTTLRIALTRDLRGWLEPCDRKEGVLGGFPRRATVLAPWKPDLLLDAGDLVNEPCAAWEKTAHARALSALRPEKGLYDPLCLACHATAPGTGGDSSAEKTPEFAGVTCECGHGPCRAHAETPLTAARAKPPGRPEEVCLTGHESDHRRPFSRPERLGAIRYAEKE